MTVIIKSRGDTAANWTAANPVLAAREIGLELDTQRVKVGDGVTAWNSLPYWLFSKLHVFEADTTISTSSGTWVATGDQLEFQLDQDADLLVHVVFSTLIYRTSTGNARANARVNLNDGAAYYALPSAGIRTVISSSDLWLVANLGGTILIPAVAAGPITLGLDWFLFEGTTVYSEVGVDAERYQRRIIAEVK